MKYLLIHYPKCSTCQRARAWLLQNGVEFEERDIKLQNPTAGELREWSRSSGVPVMKLFNTSGMLYRSMNLKERLPGMDEEQQLALLATDGMLVKRPLLVGGDGSLLAGGSSRWKAKDGVVSK